MNNRIILLIILFSFLSCAPQPVVQETEPTQKIYFHVYGLNSNNNNSLSYYGGKINITIHSNTEWICSAAGARELNVTVDKSKGFGDDVVIFTYASTFGKQIVDALHAQVSFTWKSSEGRKTEIYHFIRNKNPLY